MDEAFDLLAVINGNASNGTHLRNYLTHQLCVHDFVRPLDKASWR